MKIEAAASQIQALLRLDRPGAMAEEERALPEAILERYHSLLRAGRTPAVVAIERGACSGCHILLPAILEHKAGRSLALYTCPRCQRLLYAPELLGGETRPDQPPGRRGARGGGRRR
jgi:predicted  nucleic acid-binding Zn-ribbon protein